MPNASVPYEKIITFNNGKQVSLLVEIWDNKHHGYIQFKNCFAKTKTPVKVPFLPTEDIHALLDFVKLMESNFYGEKKQRLNLTNGAKDTLREVSNANSHLASAVYNPAPSYQMPGSIRSSLPSYHNVQFNHPQVTGHYLF